MFAQTSATKSLSITVSSTPASTGNLLTGKTPANFSLPSGWTLLCTQDFEAGVSNCTSGSGTVLETGIQTTSNFHPGTGSHSIYGTYGTGNYTPVRFGTGVPNGYTEIYQSWYQSLSSVPGGLGWCYGGGNYYLTDFRAGHPDNTYLDAKIDPGGGTVGTSPGQFCFNRAYWEWLPEGTILPPTKALATIAEEYDNSWHQWEVHYKPNTPGSSDGILEVWKDGVKIGPNLQNVSLNGSFDMTIGMEQYISGHYTSLVWLNNVDGQAQSTFGARSCEYVIAHPGSQSCAASVGTGYGCDGSYENLTFAQINQLCPGQAPSTTFNKYIDDVIVLKK